MPSLCQALGWFPRQHERLRHGFCLLRTPIWWLSQTDL